MTLVVILTDLGVVVQASAKVVVLRVHALLEELWCIPWIVILG